MSEETDPPATQTSLPVELSRLVQHVELNRSGWWNQALEKLLVATAWLAGPCQTVDLVAHLSDAVGARISQDRVDDIVGRLLAAGTILELPDGRLKVSDEYARALDAERREVEALEQALRERIGAIFVAHDLPVAAEEAWADFDSLFLAPMLRDAGFRVYELLTSRDAAARSEQANYGTLMRPLCNKYGDEVRAALVEFLDPADAAVRSYLLRRLSGQFAREGAALDDDALRAVSVQGSRPARAAVLLDSNFVFSILGLHYNPSNDVASDLLDLIGKVSSELDVKLYVLPITIDEIRRVLRDVIFRLSNLTLSSKLATAAGPIHSSGLVDRFFDAARSAKAGRITADEFFGPYEANPITFLRARGVDIFQDPSLDTLTTDQQVIDDVHEQSELQARTRARGEKPYEANVHDMVLWHLASRRRPKVIESPLDAQFWIATVDFGLIAFDRRKRSHPPIALTPSALIHVLQFWVPRNDVLDRALVGSLREPLLFLDFDKAAEEVTVRILRQLSRYENSDDLSPELLKRVILNDALRTRLAAAPTATELQTVEMIESAFADEAQRLLEEREEAAQRQREAEAARLIAENASATAVRALEEELSGKETALADAITAKNRLSEKLTQATKTAETVAALEAEQDSLRDEVRAARRDAMRDGQRVTIGACAAVFAIGALLSGAAMVLIGSHVFGAAWLSWASGALLAVVVWLVSIEFVVRRQSEFRDTPNGRRLHRSRRKLLAMLGVILLNLIASAVWAAAQASHHSPRPKTPTSSTRP